MFSLGVIGSRSFHDYEAMEYEIDRIFKAKKRDKPERNMCIVSGGARGADSLAKRYANEHPDVDYIEHKPNWEKHGKKAGFMRNVDIVNDSNMVLSFWNGKSKGTKHTMGVAQSLGKRLKVVRFR